MSDIKVQEMCIDSLMSLTNGFAHERSLSMYEIGQWGLLSVMIDLMSVVLPTINVQSSYI